MKAVVTGATGFLGGHLVRALGERGDEVRVTYRDPGRLARLTGLDYESVRTDVLDRAGIRRAMRGVEVVFHSAGYVSSRPPDTVWQLNALAPRVVVEAAAACDVPRVVLTSSVAAIGAAPHGEVADESQVYRSARGLIYGDAKHEGEVEALAAGARLGVEVVIVNPSYVLGVPVDRSVPGETSTRVVANYLLGRLPLIVDGAINIVDVEDVAAGHLLAADRGVPGGRYILGGYNLRWAELIDRLTTLSGVRHPLAVMPTEIAALGRIRHELGIPGLIAPEAWILLASNWRYSSRKAARELGYRARPLDATLLATIDWYQGLIKAGALDRGPSVLSVGSRSLRIADRFGLGAGLRAAEHYVGRRLVAGT